MSSQMPPVAEFKELAFSTYHEAIVWELRAAIERYFDFWENLHWKQEEACELHLGPVEQHRLPIIILSCTLLECIINFYLCTKCRAEEFERLDRKYRLFEKWV